jgi:2-polyprenyl-6-methoxyphenol hydroxylase and related FAD-dependent oxidoreductases
MIQSVAIIGAGIAGLTAGCALRRYGFEVDIFERSDSITEFGAGITLSKNATSLLGHIDLYDELAINSSAPKGSFIRHYKTAKDIAYMEFTGDFITADRRDVVNIFADRFVDLGGRLHFDQTIEVVDVENGRIFLSGGSNHTADIVFVCDGIKSTIREKEFDSREPSFTNYIAWRGVVDKSDFPIFPGNDEVNIYHGPGGHVVHYPIGHEDKINFVAIETKESWEEESWKREGDKKDLLLAFEGWNKNIQELFSSADEVYKWGVFDRAVPEQLSKGRFFLLGDAAHPMVPFRSRRL